MSEKKLSEVERAKAALALRKLSEDELTELFLFGQPQGLHHLAMAEIKRREAERGRVMK